MRWKYAVSVKGFNENNTTVALNIRRSPQLVNSVKMRCLEHEIITKDERFARVQKMLISKCDEY